MARMLTKNWLRFLLLFILAFGVAFAVGAYIKSKSYNPDVAETDTTEEGPIEEIIELTPAFIDLQPTIDSWLSSINAKVGLMIYDLDHDQVAAEHNSTTMMESASVYKLFFAYDGYTQIDRGQDNGEAYYTTTYDKGDLSLYSCLDLIIRESYNGCADPLRQEAGRFARAEELAQRLGLSATSSAGLYSSAADLTKLMQLFWEHPDLSSDSWERIQDSMLNQPITTYDWRQGLPSGFNQALVYDKVGWSYTGSYWSIYNDVAFVVFPEIGRHYIVVVLTSGLSTYQPLVDLGNRIETTVLESSVL